MSVATYVSSHTLTLRDNWMKEQIAAGEVIYCHTCDLFVVGSMAHAEHEGHTIYTDVRFKVSNPDDVSCDSEYGGFRKYEKRARQFNSEKKWRSKNPEKYAAKAAVYVAVHQGKLVPQPCEICGSKGEAHHDDYSNPLDVRWLCRRHHTDWHRSQPSKEEVLIVELRAEIEALRAILPDGV